LSTRASFTAFSWTLPFLHPSLSPRSPHWNRKPTQNSLFPHPLPPLVPKTPLPTQPHPPVPPLTFSPSQLELPVLPPLSTYPNPKMRPFFGYSYLPSLFLQNWHIRPFAKHFLPRHFHTSSMTDATPNPTNRPRHRLFSPLFPSEALYH